MNGLTIIDTDILIDAAMSIDDAVKSMDHIEHRSELAVSVITQMELLAGCRNKKEVRNTERFLKRFHVINMNEAIGDAAVELLRQYRMSHGLMIPDALIAATALTMNRPFISKNRKDYRFIHGLQLSPYPVLILP